MSSEELAGLQKALLNTDSVEQFLHELAVLATRTVGGGDAMSCGMALRQRGRTATATACSDPMASQADQAQHADGGGPAVDALRYVRPVNVQDTAAARRSVSRRVMLMNITTRNWRASHGQLPRTVPVRLAERSFRHGDIPAARQFTRAFGDRAQLNPARLADFVLAVSEATASATARGPGTARVRLWVTGTRAFCEVRGNGVIARQAPHVRRDGEEEALRRWVLQQFADYVSVASGPDGAWVLLSMTVS